jgi:hypothetical protein
MINFKNLLHNFEIPNYLVANTASIEYTPEIIVNAIIISNKEICNAKPNAE